MITKDLEILDIVDAYPETEEIFKSYDKAAGVCVLCTHLFEKVEEFAEMHGLDLDEMIDRLGKAVNK